MKVLVTGGAGYIGSTTCVMLENNGYTPIILDSLVCGKLEFVKNKCFYKGDITDIGVLTRIFNEHPDIKHAIHFAAYIIVPESVVNPYYYYYNNVAKSIEFFNIIRNFGCNKVIFSSSASVYGSANNFEVRETDMLSPQSPYATTKYMMEKVLEDYTKAYNMQAIVLRYFNPIGAEPKLTCGAYAQNPTHLLGRLIANINNSNDTFYITGVNWPTIDGSGVRDYIHVWDLAKAHLQALKEFDNVILSEKNNFSTINIGTGNGVTVKQFVEAFEKVYEQKVNKDVAPARQGDVAGVYANCDKAKNLLKWTAELSIEKAISDALNWDKVKSRVLGNW